MLDELVLGARADAKARAEEGRLDEGEAGDEGLEGGDPRTPGHGRARERAVKCLDVREGERRVDGDRVRRARGGLVDAPAEAAREAVEDQLADVVGRVVAGEEERGEPEEERREDVCWRPGRRMETPCRGDDWVPLRVERKKISVHLGLVAAGDVRAACGSEQEETLPALARSEDGRRRRDRRAGGAVAEEETLHDETERIQRQLRDPVLWKVRAEGVQPGGGRDVVHEMWGCPVRERHREVQLVVVHDFPDEVAPQEAGDGVVVEEEGVGVLSERLLRRLVEPGALQVGGGQEACGPQARPQVLVPRCADDQVEGHDDGERRLVAGGDEGLDPGLVEGAGAVALLAGGEPVEERAPEEWRQGQDRAAPADHGRRLDLLSGDEYGVFGCAGEEPVQPRMRGLGAVVAQVEGRINRIALCPQSDARRDAQQLERGARGLRDDVLVGGASVADDREGGVADSGEETCALAAAAGVVPRRDVERRGVADRAAERLRGPGWRRQGRSRRRRPRRRRRRGRRRVRRRRRRRRRQRRRRRRRRRRRWRRSRRRRRRRRRRRSRRRGRRRRRLSRRRRGKRQSGPRVGRGERSGELQRVDASGLRRLVGPVPREPLAIASLAIPALQNVKLPLLLAAAVAPAPRLVTPGLEVSGEDLGGDGARRRVPGVLVLPDHLLHGRLDDVFARVVVVVEKALRHALHRLVATLREVVFCLAVGVLLHVEIRPSARAAPQHGAHLRATGRLRLVVGETRRAPIVVASALGCPPRAWGARAPLVGLVGGERVDACVGLLAAALLVGDRPALLGGPATPLVEAEGALLLERLDEIGERPSCQAACSTARLLRSSRLKSLREHVGAEPLRHHSRHLVVREL